MKNKHYHSLFIQFLIEYFRVTCIIAGLLHTIEAVVLYYHQNVRLKRFPNYDHDFLSIWVVLCNIGLSFYLGWIQTHSKSGLFDSGHHAR